MNSSGRIKYCFLDQDGVLADIIPAICNAHSRPDPYTHEDSIIRESALGKFDMDEIWGMSPREFWEPINNHPEFWRGLKKTLEADHIVDLAVSWFGVDNVAILTAPSMDPSCVPGKREWVGAAFQRYPQLKQQMIFTAAKKFLAGPDRLLIDDRDRNVEEFVAGGGHAILLPRLHNADHRLACNSEAIMRTLEFRLKVICSLDKLSLSFDEDASAELHRQLITKELSKEIK